MRERQKEIAALDNSVFAIRRAIRKTSDPVLLFRLNSLHWFKSVRYDDLIMLESCEHESKMFPSDY